MERSTQYGLNNSVRVTNVFIRLLVDRGHKAIVGLRPSFSAHVRWCERRAPVQSGGAGSLGLRGDAGYDQTEAAGRVLIDSSWRSNQTGLDNSVRVPYVRTSVRGPNTSFFE